MSQLEFNIRVAQPIIARTRQDSPGLPLTVAEETWE